MSSTTIDPGGRSPADIEDDVERTRANVSGTLDALREKLAPSQIVDEVIDRVSDYARGSGGAEFARNLGSAVRDNPLPVLLIGAGIGWMLLSRGGSGTSMPERDPLRLPPPRRPFQETGGQSSMVSGAMEQVGKAASAVGEAATRAGSYVSETASQVVQAGSSLASSAIEGGASASQTAASLRDSAGSATEQATAAVKAGWSSATGAVEAQPWLLGLLGVAVGATLGAVLPRTQAEDEWLGEAADAATERVSHLGREAVEQVRAVAGEHLQGASDTVAEGFAKVKERLDEGSLSGAGEALGEALSTTAKAAGDAATGLAGEVNDRLAKDETPAGEERRG
ncbi:DUF3618 domain-containing protein [Roseococcus sp. SYP-B2431]|uniref:DUF3618 domain-containing protein n=1 Tax=Roseococcus sp. SYP-B2431 TaxID=2496640 RepID=UPI00103A7280|nr:DUF3618 domain-containing protein [Roseococcus sp. SYP-B2431]TCH97478.1 DUF3618 domain-containing protein [Roseococcus sp. SYP-B2431]